jgi:hypothetical protein
MIHTAFAVLRLFFRKASVIFNTVLSTLSKMLYTIAVKFNCLDFRAHWKRYRETLNKLRQRIDKVRSNRNMKDIFLFQDNAQPHSSLRTREAIAKMGCIVLPHPAHGPDLASADYHLCGPAIDALLGRHFADDNEMKQSFHYVL